MNLSVECVCELGEGGGGIGGWVGGESDLSCG